MKNLVYKLVLPTLAVAFVAADLHANQPNRAPYGPSKTSAHATAPTHLKKVMKRDKHAKKVTTVQRTNRR